MSKESRDEVRQDKHPELTEVLVSLTHELHALHQAISNANNNAILIRLAEMERKIMATQAELAADLRAVRAQQEKTATEIAALQEAQNVAINKITELEALVAAGGTVTQELVDAVAAVKAQAQVVDDLIPDAPPVP